MKLKTTMFFAALAVTAGTAFSQTTRVFDITGATAFRASANNAIIQILGGASTEYAFTGDKGIAGTNRAIFKGTMQEFPGDTIIVRASWSGSTQGILDVADQNAIQFLETTNTMAVAPGINLGQGTNPAPDFTTAVAQWSFSDVDKLLSERPNHAFGGGPVGVVPFMFLAGHGAPAALDNMTDQLHATLWSNGQVPMEFITGNAAHTDVVLATGRNNGSGTRATILAETQYGAFVNVTQFGANTIAGDRGNGTLDGLNEFGNGGNSSNSGVRDLLTRQPVGALTGAVFVSYLTISDANAALLEGAQEMTYNGVAFSADNVKKGLYSLWGYQQFYLDSDATTAEQTFDTAFRAAIPGTLDGINAIPISAMPVNRTGGDGGPIAPGNNYPNP